jgi:ribosomal protein S18 acetylase RimI-like enzyme
MNYAKDDDITEILNIFKPYKKEVFPYLRKDTLQEKIRNNNVIYEDGVVIVFGVYKKKQKIGTVTAVKGDAYISEIATVAQGSGNASEVLHKFYKEVNTNIWLTVRSANERARAFYLKNEMKEVGTIVWSSGTLLGTIYKYEIL